MRETGFYASGLGDKVAIQDLYAALTRDEARNAMILNDVVRALEDGRSPILLTERKEHLEYFATRLEPVVRNLVVLQGGMGAKADRAVRAQLDAIPSNEERLVLATGKYVGEGFDDARLDTLFWRCPSRGRAPSCSTRGGSTGCIPASTKFRYSTMLMGKCRC